MNNKLINLNYNWTQQSQYRCGIETFEAGTGIDISLCTSTALCADQESGTRRPKHSMFVSSRRPWLRITTVMESFIFGDQSTFALILVRLRS